jgi:hypothetical protein
MCLSLVTLLRQQAGNAGDLVASRLVDDCE